MCGLNENSKNIFFEIGIFFQIGKKVTYIPLGKGPVFLFGILGMGAGPSELGKSACEIRKLGKVEMNLKP